MTTAWILLGVAVALIVANGVFVAAETALVTVDRGAVERAAAAGSRRSGLVARALRSLSTQLSGAQLGITVTSLAVGLVSEPSLATLLHTPLSSAGLGADAVEPTAVAVALLVATLVQMVLGELVPKNFALARPEKTAGAVILVLVGFTRVARPLIALLNGAANALLRIVGVEPVEEMRSARTPDELALVVRRAGQQGGLEDATATLMERSLVFGGKTASDVMTPRIQMRTVQADAPVADVIAATRATGHSRFPVLRSGADDVVGLVHVKQAVAVAAGRREQVTVAQVMSAPVLVPATVGLDPLLDLLQERGLQMAVVVDEYAGTDGIVTFEDLVEELVGDVVDEHDRVVGGARRRPDGSWIVSGLLRPDEVLDATGVALPDGHGVYETVSGLLMATLGRVPAVGDTVTVPGADLTVERLDGRRVDRVCIAAQPATDDDAADDHAADDHAADDGRERP